MKETAIKEAYSKSQILNEISEDCELTRKDVANVLGALETIMLRHLKRGGIGEFKMPGLFKVRTIKKPATPARKGVPNPFRPGELMDVAAKPASKRLKINPLKGLKDMIG